MSINTLHTIFSWVAIAAALLTLISGIGTHYTSKIINRNQESKIQALRPRHLSLDQKNKLVTMLAAINKSKIGFISRLMDGESADFADELSVAFKDASWDVTPTGRTSLNDFPNFVSIFVTGDNLDQIANSICGALNAVGISCRPENIQQSSIGVKLDGNAVYVVVGRKK